MARMKRVGRGGVLVLIPSVLLALLLAACQGAQGLQGPPGPTGPTGPAGQAGKAGEAGPSVVVVIEPATVVQGRFVSIRGAGFKSEEGWLAVLPKATSAGTDVVLAGGTADKSGVFFATGAAGAVGVVPTSVRPGVYLVSIEGTAGSKASSVLAVVEPTPTPRPPTPTPTRPPTTPTATPAR